MTAIIIPFPRTGDGRDALREAIAVAGWPPFGQWLAIQFDWDESAADLRRLGLAPEPPPRREWR